MRRKRSSLKSRSPLRRWLALQFALVAAVPLVTVAVLVWVSLLPQMRTDISIGHQALARAIAGEVSAHLRGANLELRAVADYIDQEGRKFPSFWFRLLDAHAGNGEVFEAIYMVDGNDEVHSLGLPYGRRANRQDLIGLDLSRRDFLRQVRSSSKDVWSETFLSTVSSRLAVAVALPIADWVVIGEITVDQLAELISRLPDEPGLLIMIVDRHGRIIADSRQRTGAEPLDSEVLSLFPVASRSLVETQNFEMDGEWFIGSVVSVEQVGWRVLVAQTDREAFRAVTTTLRMVAAGLGFSLVLALAAGWMQARSLVRYFGRYTEQARAIANGDYDQPWPVSKIRELADLIDNLQRMSHAIRDRESRRERAEASLRGSEERFRTLIESSPLPIVLAREGIFIYVNSAYCRMIGVDTADEVINTSLLDTVAPEKREEVLGYMAARARNEEAPVRYESVGIRREGTRFPYEINVAQVNLTDGPALIAYISDITERKRTEKALEKRLVALTQPLDAVESIAFEDLFNLSDIQRLQDLFSETWGVAALITRPDGTPITQPSNFTYFCGEFIRKNEKGLRNCQASDAMLGRHNPSGPVIRKCASAGLCGAGASISVGGYHIANWLIGQVRNEAQSEEEIIEYAREIESDETAFREAFLKVPTMPQEKFEQIAQTLFVLANQLSTIAYQNIQQARFIHERKRAEEALQQISKLQSVILENSMVGIALVKNRIFEWVNPKMRELFALPVEQLQGASTRIIYPSDEVYQRVGTESYPLLVQGRKAAFELELRKGEGSLFWCRLEGKALDAANIEEGVIWIAEDITERKQERKSLLRTQFAMDRARDSILWVDDEGCIVYANDSACTSLGYTRDELLMMTVFEIDPDFPLNQWEQHKRDMQRRGTMLFEGRHCAKDGRIFPVEISSSYVEFEGRWFACASDRDITERKRAEEEMRRLRNYLSNIINSMPSVLVGVDTDGRVTHWNTAAERATGVVVEQAQGQPLDQVLPMLSSKLRKLKEAIRTRRVETEAKVPRIVDGEMRYEDVTMYPLTSNGVEGAVIRVDDVTEQVRIEEMMVQSEKMLSVGGLAAGMAHEINNPLGVILQASQNILRRTSPDLPINVRIAEECGTSLSSLQQYFERREILTFIEDIRQNGQRAAEIVASMLNFSRKAEATGTPTDLAELLDRTLSLAASDYDLKKHHDFRQIEIRREYQAETPPVICQANKIQQVFLNILRNGAEAMMAAKDSIRAPLFILRVGHSEGMVRVEIEDNGPGMDEATRKRVFEPFFTTKPPGSGTGLGLSVSYFIVTEDHGGSMSVESSTEVGTRFIIRLPVEGKRL